MADVSNLLEAGALLSAKQKIPKDEVVDSLSARTYRHAGLGDRPVVRLTADSLAQGDDLAMEFLGFEPPQVEGPIAQKRRQALGFPAWALIHDPKHAHYALQVVKEFRKAARRSKAKPGHGWDEFTAIAKTLGRSVAHFLPSFWEEVGREFIHLGNRSYGSRAFSKAREAEKVHALKVDKDVRNNAFLEFALAGCLTAKALMEYAKEMQESLDAAEAWRTFRDLCVRRTLGGVPPWASMAHDLQRVIKAAGLDVEKESLSFLREIISAPCLANASEKFWDSYEKPIQLLAKEYDEVAGALLNLMPESGYHGSMIWPWIERLEKWGILSNAWEGKVPKAAQPNGGPAAWLSKRIRSARRYPEVASKLLTNMGARLKKDKVDIDMARDTWGGKELPANLVDLALELKVPVADPDEKCSFNLDEWAGSYWGNDDDEPDLPTPRDLDYLIKAKRFGPLVTSAVANSAGNATFEAAAAGKASLADARRNWLIGIIEQMGTCGLPALHEGIEKLGSVSTRATFQEFADGHPLLTKINVAELLQATLQSGILDEFGWQSLEEAAEKLDPKGKAELKFYGTFPRGIVSDGVKAIVVDAEKAIAEFELKLPKKHSLQYLRYVDDQLCIVARNETSWDDFFYWAGQAKNKTEITSYFSGEMYPSGAVVPIGDDGGEFDGEQIHHAGSKKLPSPPDDFLCDGEHFWKAQYSSSGPRIKEFDPRNRKAGRESLPSFLEDYAKDQWTVETASCHLLPLGESVPNSPLGAKKEMLGFRVRSNKDKNKVECESIDGRKWSGRLLEGDLQICALLRFPGADELCPVATSDFARLGYYSGTMTIYGSDGKFRLANPVKEGTNRYNAGRVTLLPPLFWNLLAPRDEKTSKKLRKISKKNVNALLTAVNEDLVVAGDTTDVAWTASKKAVDKALPKIQSERLRNGIIAIVHLAAELDSNLKQLTTDRDPKGKDLFAADQGAEKCAKPGLDALGIDTGYQDEPFLPHLTVAIKFLSGEVEANTIVPKSDIVWFELFGAIHEEMWSSYWEKDLEELEPMFEFLEICIELGVFDLPGKTRYAQGELTGKTVANFTSDDDELWKLYEKGGNRYLLKNEYGDGDVCLMEYAPDGKFSSPPGFETEKFEEPSSLWNAEELRAFIAGARQNDRPPIQTEKFRELAEAAHVTYAEAAFVWLGSPYFGSWDHNFLPKEFRESLGIKVKEASTAKSAVQAIKRPKYHTLINVMLADPKEIWIDDAAALFGRLTKEWGGSIGQRLEVPPEFITQLEKVFGYQINATDLVAAFGDPKSAGLFTAEKQWKIENENYYSELTCQDDNAETFNSAVLWGSATMISLLFHQFPVGATARSKAVEAYDACHKCLKSPKLMLELAQAGLYTGRDSTKKLEAILGQVFAKTKREGATLTADDGVCCGVVNDDSILLAFRPAKVKTKKMIEKLESMGRAVQLGESDSLEELAGYLQIQSAGAKAICQRIKKTPVAEGSYEANPLQSVPDLVSDVAKKKKLSDNASMAYLQTLALHDCTSKNLQLWNDWSTSDYNKAMKELEAAKLLLKAKRSRAGRNYFLPGGWEALKLPNLPLETWKLPLFSLTRDGDGRVSIPLKAIVPLEPVHAIFEKAWQRVLAGDAPKYEEVR